MFVMSAIERTIWARISPVGYEANCERYRSAIDFNTRVQALRIIFESLHDTTIDNFLSMDTDHQEIDLIKRAYQAVCAESATIMRESSTHPLGQQGDLLLYIGTYSNILNNAIALRDEKARTLAISPPSLFTWKWYLFGYLFTYLTLYYSCGDKCSEKLSFVMPDGIANCITGLMPPLTHDLGGEFFSFVSLILSAGIAIWNRNEIFQHIFGGSRWQFFSRDRLAMLTDERRLLLGQLSTIRGHFSPSLRGSFAT